MSQTLDLTIKGRRKRRFLPVHWKDRLVPGTSPTGKDLFSFKSTPLPSQTGGRDDEPFTHTPTVHVG